MKDSPFKEVILYGGSFDPPHMAHLQCLARLAQVEFCSEVWITPSGERIDKPDISSFEHRAHMCQILAEHVARSQEQDTIKIRVEMSEGDNETRGTWELIERLKAKQPYYNFSLAIGSDLLKDLPNWRHPEQLKLVPLVVLKRAGADLPNSDNTRGYRVREVILQEFSPISSSAVRERLANKDWERLGPEVLPPEVREYIINNQLYGLGVRGGKEKKIKRYD